jgi:hypothetical protein
MKDKKYSLDNIIKALINYDKKLNDKKNHKIEKTNISANNVLNNVNSGLLIDKTIYSPKVKKDTNLLKNVFSKFGKKDLTLPITISLMGINTSKKINITLNKSEFTIGSGSDKADGVINFNNAISRIHCKIIFKNQNFYLVDLNSTNGTFVNSKKLEPNKPFPINVGSKIGLADSEFIIKNLS